MNEPSVLDYLKSIFRNWIAFSNFVKAVLERRDITRLMQAGTPALAVVKESRPPIFDLRNFPWLTLLVLVLALAGQKTFEPPQQLYNLGIIFYLSAFGLALIALRRREWSLASVPADETQSDTFSVRAFAFVLSLIFGAFAFYLMAENRFTAANLTFWAGAIFFHLWAFWVREPRPIKIPALNLSEFFARSEWTLRITRWGLLIFLLAGLTLFFRTYRLDTVVPEMTSDHAEKLMDVYDITQGQYSIYFPRNTGREFIQMYLAAFVSQWFGLSLLTLKIVATFSGVLTVPYIYLLGREMGGARVGLLAAAFAGFGYWPTVLERFGLRHSLYPLFAAATLYYFVRGLRRQQRNDFILAGAALGLGLNGYTPFRIMPIALVLLLIVYLLHVRDSYSRKQVLIWFFLLVFTAWILVIPLARFALEQPAVFGERAFSRLGTTERAFPAPVWQLFLLNFWNALKEFNWYNGDIWVHSVTHRPALDTISGALFLIGVTLMLIRYIRNRHWQDLMILLAIPLLQMPSILSLAYPEENPSLNRTSGALVPAFVLVGFGLECIWSSFTRKKETTAEAGDSSGGAASARPARTFFATAVVLGLIAASFAQNYDLIFKQYYNQYRQGAWNSGEMGAVIKEFVDRGGPAENVWIVPFAFWVDTRLPSFWAGLTPRDMAIGPDRIAETVTIPGAKLILFMLQDEATRHTLEQLYPNGSLTVLKSSVENHDFYVFRVPAQ